MTVPSAFEYQVGGTVAIESPTYVTRQADADLYAALQAGEFCYVLNCRQMGKSSLRARTMQRLQAEGVVCAAVDISVADAEREEWYSGIISSLAYELKLTDFNLDDWWQQQKLLPLAQRFGKFLEAVVLRSIAQKIVIFIDEIDSMLSLKFNTDDFFATIRECYNRRADQPMYRRLSFTLLGVSTPADLIQDRLRTPFNVGRAIDLSGFQLEDVQPLAQGLAGLGDAETLMQAVLDWTGGQPFLTQKLCKLLVQEGKRSDALLQGADLADWVGAVVQRRVIENWEAQDEPEHLRHIRDRLLLSGQERTGRLLGLCQQMVQQGEVAAEDSPEQLELRLTGLAVKRQGKLRIYNRIYAAVFDLAWVERQLAKLRPYAAALRVWEKSGRQDESRLLRGQTLADAQQWAAGKSLSDLDYQFLRASEELSRREVAQQLQTQEAANQILTTAQQKAEQELADALRQRRRIRRSSFATAGVAVAVAIAAAGFTAYQIWRTQLQIRAANARIDSLSSEQQFASGQPMLALRDSLEAGQQLQSLDPTLREQENTQARVTAALFQAVYGISRERSSFSGHQDAVRGVSFSPDGKTIASASADKTIKLWNVADGKELRTLSGHQSEVYSTSFSPDGKTIASASADKTIKLWNVVDGKELRTLSGHQQGVTSVSFSPDGQTIASASEDSTVKLWNVTDGKELRTLSGHQQGVTSVSFSPDGQTIASASRDITVKLWNVADGKELRTLSGNQVESWNLADGKKLRTLSGHQGEVTSVSFSPDGQTLASASEDKTIKLWNVADGRELRTLLGHQMGVISVSFSPDGQTLASASDDSTVKLWNVTDGKELRTLLGHQMGVISVSFSPDGQTLASTSEDKTIKLWNVTDGKELRTLSGHQHMICSVNSISFSPDSKTIASTSGGSTVKLWNVADGKELRTLSGNQNAVCSVSSVSFSPDGKTIASASADKTIKLWNVADGKELRTLSGNQVNVYSTSFSPDGKTIASASEDKTIKLWNVADGKELRTLSGHQAEVRLVSFSPDGKTIASASEDKTIKLWNVADGKELRTLSGHQFPVSSVSFSPDGKTIASASELNNTVKLWNVADGKELRTLFRVSSVSFSPDGQTLAFASWDKTIKLWNVADGKELRTLSGHQFSVSSVSFSPDGKTIASASEDGTIKLWNWDLDRLMVMGCDRIRPYLVTHASDLETLPVCQTPQMLQIAAENLVTEGETLAKDQQFEAAIDRFNRALQWQPDLAAKLSPKIAELHSQARLNEGKQLANQGKIPEAIAAYTEAEKLDPTLISAEEWNHLCWEGSVFGHAAQVLDTCEKAVALDPSNKGIQDSRGLARALTGKAEGAIKDFQAYGQVTDKADRKSQRQRWINALEKWLADPKQAYPFTYEALKAGKAPFQPGELEQIKGQ